MSMRKRVKMVEADSQGRQEPRIIILVDNDPCPKDVTPCDIVLHVTAEQERQRREIEARVIGRLDPPNRKAKCETCRIGGKR